MLILVVVLAIGPDLLERICFCQLFQVIFGRPVDSQQVVMQVDGPSSACVSKVR